MHLKLNLFKTLYRKVSSKKTPYFLAEKITKQRVSNRIEGGFAVPAGADTFSISRIGNKKDPYYKHVITSFYDSQGQIIKRHIVDSYAQPVEKDYFTGGALRKFSAEATRFFKTKKIVTKTAQPGSKPKIKEDTFYIFKLSEGQNPVKISRHTVESTPFSVSDEHFVSRHGTNIKARITEYPANYGKEPNNKALSLFAEMEMPDNYTGADIIINSLSNTPNVRIDRHDPFIAARFLLGEDKVKYLTKHFLKLKNLDNLGIKVEINPEKVRETSRAYFSLQDRAIYWKKVPNESLVAGTAAHEAEHAYQHSIIGRYENMFNLGGTAFEQDCGAILPPLMQKEIPNAKRYLFASRNYPEPGMPDFHRLYYENALEIDAQKAGEKAIKEYEQGRAQFLEQFRYIPDLGDVF